MDMADAINPAALSTHMNMADAVNPTAALAIDVTMADAATYIATPSSSKGKGKRAADPTWISGRKDGSSGNNTNAASSSQAVVEDVVEDVVENVENVVENIIENVVEKIVEDIMKDVEDQEKE